MHFWVQGWPLPPGKSSPHWKLWTLRVNQFAKMSCIRFLCCVTNYCKPIGLKQHPFIIHSVCESLAQTSLKLSPLSGLSQGCSLVVAWAAFISRFWGPLPSSWKLLLEFSSLWLGEWGPQLLDTSPLDRQFTTWLFGSSRPPGKHLSCFKFVLPGRPDRSFFFFSLNF